MVKIKGSSSAHSKLVNEVLLATAGYGVFWLNHTGMALNIRTNEPFSYGLPGSPDIIGFNKIGLFVGLECKTGNAVQSPKQKVFQAAAERNGAFYFVVRTKDHARDCLHKSIIQKDAGNAENLVRNESKGF